MLPRNRLTEYFAGETSDAQRGSGFDAAAHATESRPEVERHVARVRGSVAGLLRSLHELEHDELPDEAAVVDSCMSCADALEDLLLFLFPQASSRDDDSADVDADEG